MARVVLASYMIRYPLGGNLSWAIQWLSGFRRLGHDIVFAERAGYTESCFDPTRRTLSDDCSYGCATTRRLLAQLGLEDNWFYVDSHGTYHGMSQARADAALKDADLFIDMGALGDWPAETVTSRRKVTIDQEPGYTQMRMASEPGIARALAGYDHYFTVGTNLGTCRSSAPTGGRTWTLAFNPVDPTLFAAEAPPPDAPFTTVMNWKAHPPITYGGRTFGQKDMEFDRFMSLPRRVKAPLEVAVAGNAIPRARLVGNGWRVREGHAVTATLASYWQYICGSRGEFSVCKNVFIATQSGWFSDRSAAYLASGRPVVLQDSGFSDVVPHGRGLFAVQNVAEAAAAIDEINGDYARHSAWARELARDVFSVDVVIPRFLGALGL
ncbi:MAG: hypothetical protein EXQ96_02895 [Alphaproteobacteria bacterium]|nr:hypothetical protein [Alphaproteobacteria bacterium]